MTTSGNTGGAVVLGLAAAQGYLTRERLLSGEYPALVLWCTAGLLLLVRSVELLSIFVSLELLSVALYGLAAFHRRESVSIEAAIKWIKSIVSEPEAGMIYDGSVVKVMEFGAFVNFFGAKDGLVHISELAPKRVQKVQDVVKEGDKVKVKFLGMDERGKVRLSMKVVDQATGEDITEKLKAEREAEKSRERQNADD